MQTTFVESQRTRIRKPSAMQRIRRRMSHAVFHDESAERAAMLESRFLLGATGAVLVAALAWMVAMATDYWFHLTAPEDPLLRNSTGDSFVRSHSGLFVICMHLVSNGTNIEICHRHRLFPSSDFIEKNTEVDSTILNYTRTETAFAIISLCMMLMGLGFSFYTFAEPRYMFKRLAGGVHFLSAACVLIVIEVVVNSVQYEEKYLLDRHPKGATWRYGYSFFVACFSMVLLLLSGITFLVCSRKKKGDGFNTVDRPNIIGRM